MIHNLNSRDFHAAIVSRQVSLSSRLCGGESFHELNGVWLATVEHQLIHIGRAVVVPLEIHREAAEQV